MVVTLTRTGKGPLWALCLLTLTCVLTGCGRAVSESGARTAYEKSIKATAKGAVRVVSFRKINARRSEKSGRKYYEVEYEAELEFVEDFPPKESAPSLFSGFVMGPKGKKGEVKKASGWLPFEETENGWRGPDGNVY